MDPREYDWQLGELAALSPDFGPDERRMQPPGPEKAWAVPTTGMAPWPYMEQPAQTDAEYAQQARDAAAYRLRNPYQTAATRPPESNRLTQVAGAIGSMPGAMGELAAIPGHTIAENPYAPGSEEADFYERARKSNTYAKAPEAALNLAGVGATFPVTGGLGMLGGKMSRTADLDKLRKAEEMLKYGKTGAETAKETGWFPTAGGIMKYEISDKGAGWVEDPSKFSRLQLPAVAQTGEAFAHPRAYEAYPELADWPVVIQRLGPGTQGGFRPRLYEQDKPVVFIAPGSKGQMKRVMGHELFGHGVQELEPTWSIGGNPDKIFKEMKEGTPAWDEYQRLRSQIIMPMSREEYLSMAKDAGVTDASYEKYIEKLSSTNLDQKMEERLKRLAAFNIYEKGAGEEEARAIALRMNLGPQQIKNRPFEQSMQTPFEQQVFVTRDPLRPGKRPPAVMIPSQERMGDLADLVLSRQQQPKGFAPSTKGVMGDLFDYSKVHQVPDVPQTPIERYTPPRGVSERVQSLVKNKKVEEKMHDYIQAGRDINAETFYYNEPLRQAFIDELGKKKGNEGFARYMDYVAGSSPRSDVETNARNASYYYWLEKTGQPVPKQGGKNLQPYGHMAQNLHRQNAEAIRSGEYFDVRANPKPLSFSANLQGNFQPVTVDAHALKLPAMLSRDPRFLAGSTNLEKGVTINPTKMFEEGDITMGEAVKRPVYWAARPNPNEYAAMEQYYQRLAKDVGMTPAQTQAAAWAGGGKLTGLESVAGDPFMRAVENRAIKTAAERGISPQEALSQMMRGKAPLLSVGGAGVMGALAAQDQYGKPMGDIEAEDLPVGFANTKSEVREMYQRAIERQRREDERRTREYYRRM